MDKQETQEISQEEEISIDDIELETDDDQEEEQEESQEEQSEEEYEESDADEEEQEEQQQERQEQYVPVSALQREREKFKAKRAELERKAAIADRLTQSTGMDIEALNAQMDALAVQAYTDNGVDPRVAAQMVQQQRYMQEVAYQVQKQKFDLEASQLKTDPFFSDIDDVRDEVEPFALQFGMSLEEAYMAKRGKQRMADFRREVEQRTLINRNNKPKKVDSSGNAPQQNTRKKLNLTQDEIDIAKMMRISPEEYALAKSSSDIEVYRRKTKKT